MGVYWEGEKFPKEKQHKGWLILVIALAAEVFFGSLIFAIDGQISQSQQNTIEQMLAHRRLTPQQKERLAVVAKKYPSLNFLTITALDAESWDFVMEIATELKRHGWNWLPCDGPLPKLKPMDSRPLSCWTILDHIQVDGSQNRTEIVLSLVNALKDPAVIGMDDVRPEISEAFPTIAIMVGTKR